MNFEGQVALITGAGRGLGRALALGFARAGADVVVNYCNSEAGARETADAISAMGRRAMLQRADVTHPGEVDAMVAEAAKRLGDIDVLVNNAAITRNGPVWKLSEGDWDAVIEGGLKSIFVCTKAVVPRMRARGYGRIVNISSSGAQLGIFGTGAYAAAKAGISGFARCVAREVGARGVTVNTLLAGYLDVGMALEVPEQVRDAALPQIPLGRIGKAEEVVSAALFLGSREASYITGQELGVNGGLYM